MDATLALRDRAVQTQTGPITITHMPLLSDYRYVTQHKGGVVMRLATVHSPTPEHEAVPCPGQVQPQHMRLSVDTVHTIEHVFQHVYPSANLTCCIETGPMPANTCTDLSVILDIPPYMSLVFLAMTELKAWPVLSDKGFRTLGDLCRSQVRAVWNGAAGTDEYTNVDGPTPHYRVVLEAMSSGEIVTEISGR